MVWITQAYRGDSGLEVEVQELDGRQTRVPFKQVDVDLNLPKVGTRRRKFSIDLACMRRYCASDYLSGLGLHTLDPGSQSVYEIDVDGLRLVIPSQLLLVALLAPNAPLREAIFTPSSPPHFNLALSDVCRDALPGWARYNFNVARLEYINSYLTGRAAWSSVYRYALDGRLDFKLPRARLDIVVRACISHDTVLATALTVRRIHALELPLDFAEGIPPKVFQFHTPQRVPSHGIARAPLADERLEAANLLGPLTDDQWTRVEPLLRTQSSSFGRPLTNAPRDLVDVLLLKLGTPCSWARVPAPKSLKHGAASMLAKLKATGTWEQVVRELTRV